MKISDEPRAERKNMDLYNPRLSDAEREWCEARGGIRPGIHHALSIAMNGYDWIDTAPYDAYIALAVLMITETAALRERHIKAKTPQERGRLQWQWRDLRRKIARILADMDPPLPTA